MAEGTRGNNHPRECNAPIASRKTHGSGFKTAPHPLPTLAISSLHQRHLRQTHFYQTNRKNRIRTLKTAIWGRANPKTNPLLIAPNQPSAQTRTLARRGRAPKSWVRQGTCIPLPYSHPGTACDCLTSKPTTMPENPSFSRVSVGLGNLAPGLLAITRQIQAKVFAHTSRPATQQTPSGPLALRSLHVPSRPRHRENPPKPISRGLPPSRVTQCTSPPIHGSGVRCSLVKELGGGSIHPNDAGNTAN